MYIEAIPNRSSPPAILLRESYRENGKVGKRTLCNLSDWPAAYIEGLRGVLKGGTVIAAEREAFTVIRSLPHGHVAAAPGTARRIGLDRIVSPVIVAVILSVRCLSGVFSILHPNWLPRAHCRPPPRHRTSARCLGLAKWTRTNSTGRSIGCFSASLFSASLRSRPRWRSAISAMAPWFSMTFRQATWRDAAARLPSVATAATARKARCKSSMACFAPQTAARSPLRCSRAIPPIP